jgi:hypothetical protein
MGMCCPGNGSSREVFVQGMFHPGDASLQKSRVWIVTGTDHYGDGLFGDALSGYHKS